MDEFLALIWFLSLIFLILGLIKPRIALVKTRKQVLKIYLPIFFITPFIGAGLDKKESTSAKNTEYQSTLYSSIKSNENQNNNIENKSNLEQVAKNRSLYLNQLRAEGYIDKVEVERLYIGIDVTDKFIELNKREQIKISSKLLSFWSQLNADYHSIFLINSKTGKKYAWYDTYQGMVYS
ncbi:hypothetical protein AB9G23_07565 [Francisella philomiragia]|uniref:hypothetical protein n=1 Tax=Francisella philomiragia TaxID=28110 RepID=UPI0019044830|nr:hypothetical protein [Francisella philomiragia]MBK2024768.1 hypothetical protein [Francisella philomiragia]